ncbi:Jasmonoyl--L-amino acid synthetase JAR6 [Camellia lanceoleosa]|nr:Jasmonoyl--L-amino acid synthetase JAR6 [Camellia lanceoleosa]
MLTKDAKRVQKDTLQKILEENGNTEYLKKWGLNGRTDHENFKAFVAFVTHKDLEPYIQRMVDVHSVCQFFVSCARTTRGRPKFVLLNNELIESTMQMYKTSFAFRNKNYWFAEFPIGNGKALRSFTAVSNSKRKGSASGTATLRTCSSGSLLKNTMKAMRPNVNPYIAIFERLIYNEVQVVSSTFAHKIVYAFQPLNKFGKNSDRHPRRVLTTKSPSHPYEQIMSKLLKPNPELLATFRSPNIGYFEFIPNVEVPKQDEIESSFLSIEPKTRWASTTLLQNSNLLLTINIDKNTEKDLQLSVEAAGKLFSNEKLEVVDFTSHVDLSTDPGHYVICWEVSGEAGDDLPRECCNCLDRSFVDAGYVGSRKVETIGALEPEFLRREPSRRF